MEKLFQLYKLVLMAHIQTKTTEPLFHEKSEEFYSLLFDVFHLVSEKRQDIGIDTPTSCDTLIQATYDALEETKSLVETMVKEKNSIGMDNLLRGLADRLEGACGNARGFIDEEKEEGMSEEEKTSIKNALPNKLFIKK